MSIRNRLLVWLLPILIFFIGILSYLSYLNIVAISSDPAAIAGHLNFAMVEILLFAFIMIFLITLLVLFLANKISYPVQKLKNAALSLAAGEYGDFVHVKGPTEIVELANTLNTLSQCLEEQITGYRESSMARERMYGEYECSLLLQHYMLQDVIEKLHISQIEIRSIQINSARQPKCVYLDIKKQEDQITKLIFAEALTPGFESIFELLKTAANPNGSQDGFSYQKIMMDHLKKTIIFQNYKMAIPLVWETSSKTFAAQNNNIFSYNNGDFLILFNSGFEKLFQSEEVINAWFGKVLRHFAEEGIDAVVAMLSNELNFLANKQHIDQDMYLICVKMVD
jgi:HAMP domain-containing protein